MKSSSLDTLAKFIATAGGAGYVPGAPGTAGTAVAVPLVYLTACLPVWQFALLTALVTAIGIWAADRADIAWGTHDCQKIVIDEVAGYMVTMLLVPRDRWVPLAIGFVVFRFFDIVKPPPVRWLDQNLPRGYGVVLDDIAAGIMGMVVMVVFGRLGVF